MKTLAKTLTLALAASGLVGAAATPAFAEPIAPRTAQVTFGDLDLETVAGQRTLDNRIERAARNVCRTGGPQTGTRIIDHESRKCLARARADAKQQVAALTGNAQRGG